MGKQERKRLRLLFDRDCLRESLEICAFFESKDWVRNTQIKLIFESERIIKSSKLRYFSFYLFYIRKFWFNNLKRFK